MQPVICAERGVNSLTLEVSPGDVEPPWVVPEVTMMIGA